MHMTTARYLSMMDLGRTDLLIRSGLAGALYKKRWFPVIASVNVNVRFLRQLNPLQTFTLKTRLLGWDEKWLFIEQCYEADGRVLAVGVNKGLFRSKAGCIPSTQLLEYIDSDELSSNLPEYAGTFDDLHFQISSAQSA